MYTNLSIVDEQFFDEKFTRKNKKGKKVNTGLVLNKIKPITKNQVRTFIEYADDKHLLLSGSAGTGKTFISLYLATNEILSNNSTKDKLVIVRSVVPTRDMGFLPGNQKEKQKAYEAPYYRIYSELFRRGDAYECLKGRGKVDFITTSFIRGITINDSIVVVDECQNLNYHELDSIITRVGNNCKIIFCGDFRQSDFERDNERKGFVDFMKIIESIRDFSSIAFTESDIVRSDLVRDYIIAKQRYGIYT
jgi:phosphate starvation-inducible PhoH-like protein/PhoH-like ATPase